MGRGLPGLVQRRPLAETSMLKSQVLGELVRALTEDVAGLEAVMAAARDEATHGESRPENQYDTRALEASYLAAGQGRRMQSLQRLLGWARQQTGAEVDRAVQGALLLLRDMDDRPRTVLLAPEGGTRLSVEGTTVELVSMRSPLGQALAGLEEGDAAEVEGPSGLIEWSIEEVS